MPLAPSRLAVFALACALTACEKPAPPASVRVSGTVMGNLANGSEVLWRGQVVAALVPEAADKGRHRMAPLTWSFAFDVPGQGVAEGLGELKVREPSPCGPTDIALVGGTSAPRDATAVSLQLYLPSSYDGARHVRVTFDNPGPAATFTWGALSLPVDAGSFVSYWAQRPTCAGELPVSRDGIRLGATLPDPNVQHVFVSARPNPCFVVTRKIYEKRGTGLGLGPEVTRHTSAVITSPRLIDHLFEALPDSIEALTVGDGPDRFVATIGSRANLVLCQ